MHLHISTYELCTQILSITTRLEILKTSCHKKPQPSQHIFKKSQKKKKGTQTNENIKKANRDWKTEHQDKLEN